MAAAQSQASQDSAARNEQSAADDTEVITREHIVAALAAEAPSDAVRDCLRKYDPKKTDGQIEASLKQSRKTILVDTLAYLGVPNMEQYRAEALPHELLCRIQNLFPDLCHLCNTKYCVKLGDRPVVSCASCGQGCHNECVLQLLGISQEELSEENQYGAALLNPNAAVGFVYLCGYCQKLVLPQKDKLKQKTAAKRQPVNTATPATGAPNGGTEAVVIVEEESSVVSEGAANTPRATPTDQHNENNGNHTHTQQVVHSRNEQVDGGHATAVCKFFRMGRCKHGISGKKDGNCLYSHPKPCRKFLNNGPKSRGGCTKGTSCTLFHPKICHTSLRKRTCFREDCKFLHIKGTKRTQEQQESEVANRVNQNQEQHRITSTQARPLREIRQEASNSNQGNFLDIRELKEQMNSISGKLREIDLNYSLLLQQQSMLLPQKLSQAPLYPQYNVMPQTQPTIYQSQQMQHQQPLRSGLLPTPMN